MKEKIVFMGLFFLSLSIYFGAANADSVQCQNADVASGWTLPNNARTDGGGWAYTTSNSASLSIMDFDCDTAGLPSDAQIDGIEVKTDSWQSVGGALISVNLSNNSCSGTVGTTKSMNPAGSETTYTHGGASDTWSSGLTASDLSASTFCIRLRTPRSMISGNQVNEDWVRVKIYYTPAPNPPDVNLLQPNGGETFCTDSGTPYTFIDANIISYVDSDLNIAYWNSTTGGGQDTFIDDFNVLNPDIPLFAEEFESLWDMNLNQMIDLNNVEIVSGYAGTFGADFNHVYDTVYYGFDCDSNIQYPISYNGVNLLPLDNNTFTIEFWLKFHSHYEYSNFNSRDIFSTHEVPGTGDRNGIVIDYYAAFAPDSSKNLWVSFRETEKGTLRQSPSFLVDSIAGGTWNHLVWSFGDKDGNHQIYLNGELKKNYESWGNGSLLDIPPHGLYFGRAGPGNRPSGFRGVLDRFVIYDWNKTAAEVLYDYENDLNFYVFPNDKNTGTKQVARYRWDYSGVTAGDYFIDVNLSETSSNFLDDFDSSDASFSVALCNAVIRGHIVNPFFAIYAMPCYGAKILNNFLPNVLGEWY